MDQICSLRKLEIGGLDDLEYIEIEGQGTSFFPSLKYLIIKYCPKLMGWQKKRDDSTAKIAQFTFLSQFICHNCPKLSWIPQFPSLNEALELNNSNFVSCGEVTIVRFNFDSVVNEISNLLKALPPVVISHVLREANAVADSLAKEGLARNSDLVATL
ncbi:hypothetical protein GH714_017327 [Hevea brasiliensis]|uniref:RNase H type-1 domain-containing protein n=1 Tax=Hevea brasiliensis TaxID=3981 RepID=A0A6A6ND44_HEVBR|nr:hypothetical protein GH714_017327 [Hevea brasiliensis]